VKTKNYSPDEKAKALARVEAGETCADVARSIGACARSVEAWARKAGVKSGHLARIEERKQEAIRLLKQGERQIDVHRKTGASLSALHRYQEKLAG
jgi:transposase-like protein